MSVQLLRKHVSPINLLRSLSAQSATRAFTSSRPVLRSKKSGRDVEYSGKIDDVFIAKIAAWEKSYTKSDSPVADGPTAKAQSLLGHPVTYNVVGQFFQAEKKITGIAIPVKMGPRTIAEKVFYMSQKPERPHLNLDDSLISKIRGAEMKITGKEVPVEGGPTRMAVQHRNQPITSQVMLDILAGEKKITGEKMARDNGPLSLVKGELTRARKMARDDGTLSLVKGESTVAAYKDSSRRDTPTPDPHDSTTASVDAKWKKITGQDETTKGEPAANAQSHAGEPDMIFKSLLS